MQPEQSKLVTSKAVIRAAKSLGLCSDTLAGVIKLDTATTAMLWAGDHLLTPDVEAWGRSVLLVSLFDKLLTIVGGSEADAQLWLLSANRAFENQAPIDLMITDDGLDRLVRYLCSFTR